MNNPAGKARVCSTLLIVCTIALLYKGLELIHDADTSGVSIAVCDKVLEEGHAEKYRVLIKALDIQGGQYKEIMEFVEPGCDPSDAKFEHSAKINEYVEQLVTWEVYDDKLVVKINYEKCYKLKQGSAVAHIVAENLISLFQTLKFRSYKKVFPAIKKNGIAPIVALMIVVFVAINVIFPINVSKIMEITVIYSVYLLFLGIGTQMNITILGVVCLLSYIQ